MSALVEQVMVHSCETTQNRAGLKNSNSRVSASLTGASVDQLS